MWYHLLRSGRRPVREGHTVCVVIEAHLIPILRAAVGRIVPADSDPGAVELGADAYISGMQEFAERYNVGLRKLSDSFLQLSAEEQDGALRELEGQDPEFFELLRSQTIEGCLAFPSPIWKAMGFEVTS